MDTVRTYCDRAMLIDDGDRADDRRPDRGRRPVPAAELRAPDERRGGGRASRSRPRRSACSTSGPRARPGVRGAPVEQGEGLVVGAELEILSDLRQVERRVPADQRRRRRDLPVRPAARRAGPGRSWSRPGAGSRSPPGSTTRSSPGATSSISASAAAGKAPGPRSTSTTRSTSSSSAAASSPAGWSTSGTRSRPSSRRASERERRDRRPASCARSRAPRPSAAAGAASSTCSG